MFAYNVIVFTCSNVLVCSAWSIFFCWLRVDGKTLLWEYPDVKVAMSRDCVLLGG